MDSPVVNEIAWASARAGIASLRFNWRGVGASSGVASGDARDADADYAAALAHLAETVPGKVVACGYSFGAAAALRAARLHPRVGRVLLVAPPPSLLERGALRELAAPDPRAHRGATTARARRGARRRARGRAPRAPRSARREPTTSSSSASPSSRASRTAGSPAPTRPAPSPPPGAAGCGSSLRRRARRRPRCVPPASSTMRRRDREAEAARRVGLRGEEGLEDALAERRRNARALVLDVELRGAVRRGGGDAHVAARAASTSSAFSTRFSTTWRSASPESETRSAASPARELHMRRRGRRRGAETSWSTDSHGRRQHGAIVLAARAAPGLA